MIDETKERELKKFRKLVDAFTLVLLLLVGSLLFGYKPDIVVAFIYTTVFALLGGFVSAAAYSQKYIFSRQKEMTIRFDDTRCAFPAILVVSGLVLSAIYIRNAFMFVASIASFVFVFMIVLRFLNQRYKAYGMQLLYEDACITYRQMLDYDLLDDTSRSNVDAWLENKQLHEVEAQIKRAEKLVSTGGSFRTYKFLHE